MPNETDRCCYSLLLARWQSSWTLLCDVESRKKALCKWSRLTISGWLSRCLFGSFFHSRERERKGLQKADQKWGRQWSWRVSKLQANFFEPIDDRTRSSSLMNGEQGTCAAFRFEGTNLILRSSYNEEKAAFRRDRRAFEPRCCEGGLCRPVPMSPVEWKASTQRVSNRSRERYT